MRRTGRIVKGRWSVNSRLSSAILRQIAQRCGPVQSYTSFTGQLRGRLRGETRALELRAAP